MTAVSRSLDGAFSALGNSTRRAVVERLGRGPASVSELAAPFDMAMPSFLQHLRVLEESGLVRTHKRGRVRTVQLRASELKRVAGWLEKQRDIWEQRLDRLDAYLKTMENEDDE